MPEPRDSWNLDTQHIGRRVLFFEELSSTNTTAAELAVSEGDGLVVVTDFQTAGRGQYGRIWQAEPHSSLLMSIALRPPNTLCRPVILTAFAAVAVAEAIYALTGIQARIKWPNDLLIRGKKVCGILIENSTTTIVGIGLNLNQQAQHFADATLPDATSLRVVTGTTISLDAATDAVVRKLDGEYARLLAGELVGIEADWKWRIGLLGRQVLVEQTDGSTIGGRLREMSFGGLELDTIHGTRVLVPESVRHIRPFTESL